MKEINVERIKEMADGFLEEQTDLLVRLCTPDSESNHVEGNRQVIDIIKPVLETIPGKTALFATMLGLYE